VMKTEHYNLIEEDWIPVLMKDGSHRHVSLGEVFARGDTIADLSMVAYERISVMRLLICIAMAALDERDLVDEAAWRASRAKIPPAVAAYFAKWHNRFNFYGPHAFMQPDCLSVTSNGKLAKVDKIVVAFSSGNNGTLFDHGATAEERVIDPSLCVRSMLTYQNFSAGGQHPKCIWDGAETSVSVTAGPLREKNMVHTFLCGADVLETLWMNLPTGAMLATLPQKVLGRPIWELEALDRKVLGVGNVAATVLGRLVPLARVMKFTRGSGEIPLGNGIKYDGFPISRVMEAAVRLHRGAQNENELRYVSLSLEEAVWRNLHAILARQENHGALALGHLSPALSGCFTVWSGGLLTDGKAKDVAIVECRFTTPYAALEDKSLSMYEKGVGVANNWSKTQLFFAAKSYCEAMKIDGTDNVLQKARALFWDALEKAQPKLVHIVCDDGDMGEWDRIVAETARNAFERACPHQTGRQIAAYVQALTKLNLKKKEDEKK